jgi:hypothetical protein
MHRMPYSFVQALAKFARDANLEAIRVLIEKHDPTLLPEFDNAVQGGLQGPTEVAKHLERHERRGALLAFQELALTAAQGKAAAILPLPPHICKEVLGSFDAQMVLNSENHLPQHLARAHYDRLDDLLPEELRGRFSNITALLLEGFYDNDLLLVRRESLYLLQTLHDVEITLYVHPMPHKPHHATFKPLHKGYPIIHVNGDPRW